MLCFTSNRQSLKAILIATLCAAFSVGVFAQPSQPIAPAQPTFQAPEYQSLQSGTVTRILDQNSALIEIDGTSTRIDLLGVSGATSPRNRQSSDASQALSLLALGETVLIQYDPAGEINRANKRVAYLYRAPDHLFINLELVRQGHTRYTNTSMTIHTELFEHYEQRAQTLERGIWDPNKPIPQTNEPDEPASQPAVDRPTAPDNSTIYITAHGSKYHRKDCPHLTDTARSTTRDKVSTTHQPCKTCKPDAP